VTAQAAADHRTAHTASGSRSPHTNERAEDGTMTRDLTIWTELSITAKDGRVVRRPVGLCST
jgi:hypothetical protein